MDKDIAEAILHIEWVEDIGGEGKEKLKNILKALIQAREEKLWERMQKCENKRGYMFVDKNGQNDFKRCDKCTYKNCPLKRGE